MVAMSLGLPPSDPIACSLCWRQALKDLARPHLHHAQTINRSTGMGWVSLVARAFPTASWSAEIFTSYT